jgi:hypothetical protein
MTVRQMEAYAEGAVHDACSMRAHAHVTQAPRTCTYSHMSESPESSDGRYRRVREKVVGQMMHVITRRADNHHYARFQGVTHDM